MLSTKKITLESKSMVDGKEIMGFRAIIGTEKNDDVTLLPYQINKEACKEHRSIVRADQCEFEDYAYKFQEMLIEAATTKAE